jgi:hypothetical protein
MKTGILVCCLSALALAQNPLAKPDPYVGTFQDERVTLDLTGAKGQYSGSLTVQGNKLAVTAKSGSGNATGTFDVAGRTYSFTLTPIDGGLKLVSDDAEYTLLRKAATASGARPRPQNSGIVGTWRNATATARFNADGTGDLNGSPGRYEIQGNMLTLIGADGRATVPFEITDDTLKMTVNNQVVIMERARPGETAAGGGEGIRPELVGKWCYISITTANQGGRTSNQCITLMANGTYTYFAGTESSNPYGGTASQTADSGTWTATETSITGRSRSGKVTTFTLEKRNHPKNKNDPMIVLNGQPFVTATPKRPW